MDYNKQIPGIGWYNLLANHYVNRQGVKSKQCMLGAGITDVWFAKPTYSLTIKCRWFI